MRIPCCLAVVAFILAAPSVWAADTSPIVPLGDPDLTFRTPEGQSSPVAGTESGRSSLPAESPSSLPPGAMPGSWLFGATQVAVKDPSPMQVAQAGGASGPAPAAATDSNPWIFGATLYFWLPFATSTSTIDGLPPADKHSLFSTTIVRLRTGTESVTTEKVRSYARQRVVLT